MKIAIVGQQDFGKAVLEAFLARGDQVAAVFCAPEKEGARPDSLRVAAQEKGPQGPPVQVAQGARGGRGDEGRRRRHRHHGLRAAVRAAGVRAKSRSTARSSTTRRCCRSTAARRRSTGRSRAARRRPASPSSGRPTAWTRARWSCRSARRSARTTPWAASTSTACSRWASRRCSKPPIWLSASKHKEVVQDESQASYEGWFREAEAKIHWASHVDCDPQPDPRRRPGAGRLDHPERRQAAAFRQRARSWCAPSARSRARSAR